MNEEHLAKVNSNSKSKEKIQLSKWREQTCFWRQNSNYVAPYHANGANRRASLVGADQQPHA